MTVILASHCYCSRVGGLIYHGRSRNNPVQTKKLRIKMQHREMPSKLSRHGKVIEMVPAAEIRERMKLSKSKSKTVNGSEKNNTNGVHVINEVNLVKKVPVPPLSKISRLKELPPIDGLNVLPPDEGYSWANENYNSVQRTIDIWSCVISLRVRVIMDTAKWTYIGGFTLEKQIERRRKTALWLRKRALQLGPTFIKLGQLFSSRSDLFPKEYVDELAKLQDKVPAFSTSKAISFIESELNAPIHVLFKEFEDLPIAAASLGQVHRAILHNGEKVVVKIQRPGLKKLFDIDLQNLKLITEYFQRSETLGGPTRDWIGIYEECAKVLYQEIDYVNEAKNADRFRREFRNIKWIRVPTVFWDYTATKVLTLEYVPGTVLICFEEVLRCPHEYEYRICMYIHKWIHNKNHLLQHATMVPIWGIKINQLDVIDKRGYSRSGISSRAIEAFLIQILKTGFYHADPHPGNLAIDGDEALIYYDFGMMGEIKSFTRDRLLELFYAVYEKDAKKVMQSLVDLGALQPTGDMLPVRRSVQFFLDNLLTERPNQQQTFSAIGEDLFALATDQPFRFPSTFAFVVRAFSTLEGIGHTLDPNFSFVKVAAPYAQELLDSRQQHRTGTQVVQEIRKQADNARSYAISMPYRIQRIEDIVKQLESGDLKLRVRVLESERAALKATVLQMATIYTILSGTLLNLGTTLINRGSRVMANGSFILAGHSSNFLLRVFFSLYSLGPCKR
ncbi:Protein ACTIVITY OF BC1 COMPLEX KINASE 7, chloroplastic [Orobanche minor]